MKFVATVCGLGVVLSMLSCKHSSGQSDAEVKSSDDREEWVYECKPGWGWYYKGKVSRSQVPEGQKLWCVEYNALSYYCDKVQTPYRLTGIEYQCLLGRGGELAYTWGFSD